MRNIISKVKSSVIYGKVIEFFINLTSPVKVKFVGTNGCDVEYTVGTTTVTIWDGGAKEHSWFWPEEEPVFMRLVKFYW